MQFNRLFMMWIDWCNKLWHPLSCLRCKIFVIQFPCKSFFFLFIRRSVLVSKLGMWRAVHRSHLLDYFSDFSFFNCFVFISVENGAGATRPLAQWDRATGQSHLGMGWTGQAPLGAFNTVDGRGEAAGKMGRSYVSLEIQKSCQFG